MIIHDLAVIMIVMLKEAVQLTIKIRRYYRKTAFFIWHLSPKRTSFRVLNISHSPKESACTANKFYVIMTHSPKAYAWWYGDRRLLTRYLNTMTNYNQLITFSLLSGIHIQDKGTYSLCRPFGNSIIWLSEQIQLSFCRPNFFPIYSLNHVLVTKKNNFKLCAISINKLRMFFSDSGFTWFM